MPTRPKPKKPQRSEKAYTRAHRLPRIEQVRQCYEALQCPEEPGMEPDDFLRYILADLRHFAEKYKLDYTHEDAKAESYFHEEH